jgi:Zn-dependent protease with chaperone function
MSATYHLPDGSSFPATIFVSSVTITIRYTDKLNQQHDINWLEKELAGFEEKPGGTELQYRNKEGQVERLIITDPALVQTIKKQMGHNRFIGKPHQRVMGKAGPKILMVLAILVGIVLLAYFWFVPWLGERVAMNFSKEYEISMGNRMYEALSGTFKIDDRKTEMVNKFYKQLQYSVDYPIEITVVQSGVVNAFAIPGGHIVVYDAILEKMKTPEELAALLGHEASHVVLRHSLRNMFRNLARKMFLALVFGNDAGMLNVMVNNADELKGLEYSRSLETEADDSGLKLMAKSGIDPEGMVRLMELLQKESGGKEPSSLLNTHPVIKDRIDNIRKKQPSLKFEPADNTELKKTFHDIYEQW